MSGVPLSGFEKGDETPELTYSAVGAALSQWEQLEVYLATIFLELCGYPLGFEPFSPVARAYGTVVAFAGRVQMIDAAAEAYFGENGKEDIAKRLRLILSEAKKLSGRRNEIAHGIVQPYGPWPHKGYALGPSYYARESRR